MLKEPLGFLSKENKELEELIKRQNSEIIKTEVRLSAAWDVWLTFTIWPVSDFKQSLMSLKTVFSVVNKNDATHFSTMK